MSSPKWTNSIPVLPIFPNGFRVNSLPAFGSFSPTVTFFDSSAFSSASITNSSVPYYISDNYIVTFQFTLSVTTNTHISSGIYGIRVSLPFNAMRTTLAAVSSFPQFLPNTDPGNGPSVVRADTFSSTPTYVQLSVLASSNPTTSTGKYVVVVTYASVGT